MQEAVQDGQQVVIVNPVVVMGPGDLNIISGDFVLKIKRLQWTVPVPPGGVAVIDVRDVARMHIAAATQGQVGERYILGTANYPYAEWFGYGFRGWGRRTRPSMRVPRWTIPPMAELFDGLRALGLRLPLMAIRRGSRRANIYFDFSKGWKALGQPQICGCVSEENSSRTGFELRGRAVPVAVHGAILRPSSGM